MTADEILQEMQERAESAFDGDYSLNVIANTDVPKLIAGYRELMELHKAKTIPVSNPMGTYFSYCMGCSTIKKGINPCTDQRGLIPFHLCMSNKIIDKALGMSEIEFKGFPKGSTE